MATNQRDGSEILPSGAQLGTSSVADGQTESDVAKPGQPAAIPPVGGGISPADAVPITAAPPIVPPPLDRGTSSAIGNPTLQIDLSPPGGGQPKTEPYDPNPKREIARSLIAYLLIGILAFIVIAAMVFLWAKPDRSKEMHDLLEVLFAPMVALVGAVTGYYFGSAGTNSSGKTSS